MIVCHDSVGGTSDSVPFVHLQYMRCKYTRSWRQRGGWGQMVRAAGTKDRVGRVRWGTSRCRAADIARHMALLTGNFSRPLE